MDIKNLTLIQLRELKNLTQKDVRLKIKLSERSFRMKEKGENEFTLSEARKVSEIYKISLNDFCIIVDNTKNFLTAKIKNKNNKTVDDCEQIKCSDIK